MTLEGYKNEVKKDISMNKDFHHWRHMVMRLLFSKMVKQRRIALTLSVGITLTITLVTAWKEINPYLKFNK